MASSEITIHPSQPVRRGDVGGVRVREDSAYTNHRGVEKKSIKKRTARAIQKLSHVLLKTLRPDESVLYAAGAQAPAGLVDQLTFGWYIYYVTRVMLVFTNRRLLQLSIDRAGAWRRSARSIAWGDLKAARLRRGLLSFSLEIICPGGGREKFWNLGVWDGKKIGTLVDVLLPASTGDISSQQVMSSLCPGCFAALTGGVYRCASCGMSFKDEKTMVRRSILIPGGGYFYTGQWFLGIADFIGELTLISFLGLGIVSLFIPGIFPSFEESLLFTLLLGALVIVEKLVTVHHCRRFIREFIPA